MRMMRGESIIRREIDSGKHDALTTAAEVCVDLLHGFGQRLVRDLIPFFGIRSQAFENSFTTHLRRASLDLEKSFRKRLHNEIVSSLLGEKRVVSSNDYFRFWK